MQCEVFAKIRTQRVVRNGERDMKFPMNMVFAAAASAAVMSANAADVVREAFANAKVIL